MIELVLSHAVCITFGLAVGHIIGAWPGHVRDQRDARTIERDAARTELGLMQRQCWDTEEKLDRERIARKDAESKYFAIVIHDLGEPE